MGVKITGKRAAFIVQNCLKAAGLARRIQPMRKSVRCLNSFLLFFRKQTFMQRAASCTLGPYTPGGGGGGRMVNSWASSVTSSAFFQPSWPAVQR